jgi:hypothetical protein
MITKRKIREKTIRDDPSELWGIHDFRPCLMTLDGNTAGLASPGLILPVASSHDKRLM